MKKALKILSEPLLVLAVTLSGFVMVLTNVYFKTIGFVCIPISTILYIFVGGLILKAIGNDKYRKISMTLNAALLFVIWIIYAISSLYPSSSIIRVITVSPLCLYLSWILGDGFSPLVSIVPVLVALMLPLVYSFAGYKFYTTEKKKVKTALLVVLIFICILGAAFKFIVLSV